MRFRGDDRAVTVQIGAVLLLGFLVISLSLYQATVVPDENRQVEFQHNQRVQADILEVGNAILGTAATGSAAPATVELGTQYPTRTVAVNPSPPSGTLSTSSLGNISINNATADDAATAGEDYPETEDFWDGTTHNYTTKSLEYRPSYANYDNAPTTVYENGIVYNRFRSGNNTRSEQPVVAGTRISLVALDGELARGGAGSLVVDPQAVSVSTRTISVTNNSTGENVSVVIPSELGADAWRDLLEETGDYDPAADPSNGAYVYRVADRTEGVELYFEAGATYQLKLSKVGVGTGDGDTEPAYLTSVEDVDSDPVVGQTYPFVVESRDRYNNPIGTSVEANVPSGTVVEPGRYRYQYTASSVGRDFVNVTYLRDSSDTVYQTGTQDFDGELPENVQYDVNVQSGGGGGGGDGGDGYINGSQSDCTTGINTGGSGGSGFEISFDVTNDGDCDPITLTEFGLAYDSNGNNNVETLARRGKGSEPPDRSEEVSISGSGDGSLSSSNGKGYAVDGQFIELDSSATIGTGGTSNINFGHFYFESKPQGNDPIEVTYTITDSPPADARYFTAKLLFEDGTVAEVYIKITNINS